MNKLVFVSKEPAKVGATIQVVDQSGARHSVKVLQANPNGHLVIEFTASTETPKPRAWAETVASLDTKPLADVGASREDVEAMVEEIKRLQRNAGESAQRIQSLTGENKKLTTANAGLNLDNEKLIADVVSLKGELDTLKAASASAAVAPTVAAEGKPAKAGSEKRV